MKNKQDYSGVFTAVVTPFNEHDQPDFENFRILIQTLKNEGVNGILLAGTTGEGPMLSLKEQEQIIESVLNITAGMNLIVMAGTGCVSIKDTIFMTRRAFELGIDAVVTLPPYYFKKISPAGLLNYFCRILDEAVPDDKFLFLYDIPQLTGITMTNELIEGLLKTHEKKFCGIKDSIGNFEHTQEIINRFPQLRVMVGTDKLLLKGLQAGATGCITAGTNVLAAYAARVYQAFIEGSEAALKLQEDLTAARSALERFTPFPICLKSLLAYRFGNKGWNVRLPLMPLSYDEQAELIRSLKSLNLDDSVDWLTK